jgi:putative membrane protein
MTLKTLTRTAIAVGILTLSGGAWAQTSATPSSGAMAPKHATVSGADKDFLENAAQAGYAEIEGSQEALKKSSNPDVKKFAEQMIKDHTAVNHDLIALAKTKGYTPPDGPSIVQKTKLKAMSATSGHTFDKMYASQIGVSAHEDAVKLFQNTAAKAKDPDIKAFASDHIKALEDHLEMARTLQKQVDAQK